MFYQISVSWVNKSFSYQKATESKSATIDKFYKFLGSLWIKIGTILWMFVEGNYWSFPVIYWKFFFVSSFYWFINLTHLHGSCFYVIFSIFFSLTIQSLQWGILYFNNNVIIPNVGSYNKLQFVFPRRGDSSQNKNKTSVATEAFAF